MPAKKKKPITPKPEPKQGLANGDISESDEEDEDEWTQTFPCPDGIEPGFWESRTPRQQRMMLVKSIFKGDI